MIKDDRIEAVFIATDAPSHARLAVAALERGKHVASAVPAVFGSLEDADRLLEAVKTSGLKYMMFETSYFRSDLYAMHQQYQAGQLGKVVYSEGEYFHYSREPLAAYNPKTKQVDINGWRKGLPPQYYPTHSNAYYIGVAGGGHGGSHGYLTSEFVDAILRGRKPRVDVAQALNMTVAGIVAHQSALKDGELLKVPQYVL